MIQHTRPGCHVLELLSRVVLHHACEKRVNGIRPASEGVSVDDFPQHAILSHVVFVIDLSQLRFLNGVRQVCSVIVIASASLP